MSEFTTVARLADLQENRGVAVKFQGREVALFLHQGEVHAISGVCPHRLGALAPGWVENGKVYCPMHGWDFDLRTGACATNPEKGVSVYRVRIQEGEVQLALPEAGT